MHGRLAHELPAFQRRLDRQAHDTRPLRRPLYERAGLAQARRLLDVGSGSGAVTAELAGLAGPGSAAGLDRSAAGGGHSAVGGGRSAAGTDRRTGPAVTAVDVDPAMARRTRQRLPEGTVLCADGAALPFGDGAFDAAVCNLVLMWAPDPGALVREMARVVRPGGVVLATMEPDYGGKVHWPENPLADLVFQGDGVRRRGGDPHAGRKLREHFVRAGLRTEVGLSNLHVPTPEEDLALFRRNRRHYHSLLREAGFAAADVAAWEREYLDAVDAGIETCFLPVFHAIGRVPVPGDVDQP